MTAHEKSEHNSPKARSASNAPTDHEQEQLPETAPVDSADAVAALMPILDAISDCDEECGKQEGGEE